MKNKKSNQGKITLFYNNVLTNDPCCLCGDRTDPNGFDYGIEGRLVCDKCAEKLRPDLVKLRKEIESFIATQIYLTKQNIRQKIKDVFNETIEDRILRVVPDPDSIPF
jgi:recombinational DNA repair protein (RecF pathway)